VNPLFADDPNRSRSLTHGKKIKQVFPVNVYAAVNQIPMGGHAWGPVYLLIRAPLQAILLVWVYWFTIRPGIARHLQRREITE
jgi:uncharacterized membrane protein